MQNIDVGLWILCLLFVEQEHEREPMQSEAGNPPIFAPNLGVAQAKQQPEPLRAWTFEIFEHSRGLGQCEACYGAAGPSLLVRAANRMLVVLSVKG